MAEPHKNKAHKLALSLVETATGGLYIDPPISPGDFKLSIDGGAFANLTNLPAVSPAASPAVHFDLTAAEMNGDIIAVWGVDPDGLWDDIFVVIETKLLVDTYTTPQILAGIAAATMGEDATPDGPGPQYRAVDDSKTRITSDNERGSVTLDLS